MPKSIISQIAFGPERWLLADCVIKYVEAMRENYAPTSTAVEAFVVLLVLHRVYEINQRGREATASELARSVGLPRTTLLSTLHKMVGAGTLELRYSRYVISAASLNRPDVVRRFKSRVRQVKNLLERLKVSETDNKSDGGIDCRGA